MAWGSPARPEVIANAERKLAGDVEKTLQRIKNDSNSLLECETELIRLDERELWPHPKYPEYYKWIQAEEIKTELEIRSLAKKILKFCKELIKIENSIENKTKTKDFFKHYREYQKEYDRRIWKLIAPVDWLGSHTARDIEKIGDLLPKEKRLAGQFPELMPTVKRKYGLLRIEITQLSSLLVDLKHVRACLMAQKFF
jgi:phage host-nuclease inhibitor protein Gam